MQTSDEAMADQPKISEDLVEIVLVNRGLMEEWRKQQELLRL